MNGTYKQIECIQDFCGNFKMDGFCADIIQSEITFKRYILLGGDWLQFCDWFIKEKKEKIKYNDPDFEESWDKLYGQYLYPLIPATEENIKIFSNDDLDGAIAFLTKWFDKIKK